MHSPDPLSLLRPRGRGGNRAALTEVRSCTPTSRPDGSHGRTQCEVSVRPPDPLVAPAARDGGDPHRLRRLLRLGRPPGTRLYRAVPVPLLSPPVSVAGIPISPAWWVLWIPAGFRATCYYYRKAYYRSYFLDPVDCARAEGRRQYAGETAFPFVLNNFHRYFLYGAIIVLAFLWKDAVDAFIFNGRFGVHLGSLLFLANVVLLSGYTFGCHAFRHLAGGNLDCFSCARGGRARYRLWEWVTPLNRRHAVWAWASLFSVSLVDVYIRLLMAGVIADPRFL